MKTHVNTTLRALLSRIDSAEEIMTSPEIENWKSLLPVYETEISEQMESLESLPFGSRFAKEHCNKVQKECTNLLNEIDKQPARPPAYDTLIIELTNCLNGILEDILNSKRRFDNSQNMTFAKVKILSSSILANMSGFRERMVEAHIDKNFYPMVLGSLQQQTKLKTCTYAKMRQLECYQVRLKEALTSLSSTDGEATIINFLIAINYNSEYFLSYLKKRITEKVNMIEGIYEKLQFMFRQQGTSYGNQGNVRKHPRFDTQRPGIKECLDLFIVKEIECLRLQLKKLKHMLVPINAPVPVPYQQANYKLRFNVSVDALAYLIKLMVDTQVLEAGVKTQLYSYAAQNFSTPGTASVGIAPGSFQTKYKNVTQSTSVIVKGMLYAMIKLVDKEK